MDVNELELGDAAHEDRMGLPLPVQPLHQFRHKDRYFVGRRRRVDRLAGGGVDDIVLNLAVLPGRCRAATYPFHQALVDLADQPFRNRRACLRRDFGRQAAGQVL